ncbi:tRNA 2-thiouridine(34) synthase MnmA [Sedimentibacter sp. zth1]|uniref:tRNA 2-thiouridine(34) synthase MnmA n=1 Tax=Sedimentibacter sp. zth1 TaxID=2816908 RepID=UPI001A91FBED|nr:tRNA 2-thiouridine(34) synthase MnmA [Sedimentibacter sp. zth1]QSX06348.1 tRNA 2-thiouridine(34) synthase MnmA [Sedimentibacter sp. zth1]
MNTKTVAVALSGGVDSAVSAYILKQQGYNVFGITMKVFEGQSVEDAIYVANRLGIKHYIVDYSNDFSREVVDKFIDIYLSGGTPNPCIICNNKIKYGKLLDESIRLGADYIAFGHYAKIKYDENNNTYHLLKSNIERKDQSYLLYHLTQEKLKHIIFPLNSFKHKDDVRKKLLPIMPLVSKKKDSTDLCFTIGTTLADYIKNKKNLKNCEGNFVDKNGNFLGNHKGIFNYTIGQKRGLNLNTSKIYYVMKINAKNNEIILTDEEIDIYKNKIYVDNINYINNEFKDKIQFSCKVKVCQWGYFIDCIVYNLKNEKVLVKFNKPERAPAIGQSAVFYSDDMVIGGGSIIDTF